METDNVVRIDKIVVVITKEPIDYNKMKIQLNYSGVKASNRKFR